MPAEAGFDPEAILRSLSHHLVAYVVVGGFAVAAHGVIRATADLDLVVERSWTNAGRLAEALAALGAEDMSGDGAPLEAQTLVRRADRKFRTEHGDVHILHEVAGVPPYGDLIPADEVLLGELTVPVSRLGDLRDMKRAADRPKDRIDIAELDALAERE